MGWCKTGPANGGTKDRCEFEAAVYLNVDDFCGSMLDMYTQPDVRVKSKKTGKIRYTGYSCVNVKGVNAISLTESNYKTWSTGVCNKYKKVCYHDGKRTGDICNAVKKHFAKNPLYRGNAFVFSFQKQYESANTLYKKQEYKKALNILLDIEKNGAEGCDLFNDIAICYMNLGQNDSCIKYCKKILATSETQEYAKACYNAGRAYENKKDYASAIRNYTKAQEHYEKYGVAGADESVDYEQIYRNAIVRVNQAQIVIRSKTR